MASRTALLLAAALASLPLAAQTDTLGGPMAPGGVAVQPQPLAVRVGRLWGTVLRKEEVKPLDGKQRWRLYWRQAYLSPANYFRSAASAGLDQLGDSPEEWGQGSSGYMHRFANRYARSVVRTSLEAAGAAALGHDVRYIKCPCTGVF
jgi:hypothetical protein